MDRRAKVELFEQIRREYEHGGGTIRGIAKKLGIHRRMVREAVLSAVPVERKTPVRERPKLEPATAFKRLYRTRAEHFALTSRFCENAPPIEH